jgi:hypothetical protein
MIVSKEQKLALRKNVREKLSLLSPHHIEWLATKMLEEFPETEPTLTVLVDEPTPAFEMPEVLDETHLWPLIEKRQAMVALQGAPKDALESAVFFARIYGKLADTKKDRRPARETPPEKTPAEALAEMAQLAETNFSHEPGEATAVDSGIAKK